MGFQRNVALTVCCWVAGILSKTGSSLLALRSGDEQSVAIAHECGFRHLSQFNRQFKRLVGLTPSEYRAATAA